MAESRGWTTADQIVGDLVLLENIGGETQIGRGELAVGRLDVDDRHLGFRGQVTADLVHLGADFRQRLDRIVIELQAGVDGRDSLGALRLDVIDAVGGRDGALQRGGDESAHQIGVGADIDGGDGDHRVLAAGILADIERADRLQPGNDDHEVDHQCEDGTADKKIGEFHGSDSLRQRSIN